MSFIAAADGQPERLLIGNAFGDILTLLGDGTGHFAVNRGNLSSVPLAVGHTEDGRTFAVVADQEQDQLLVYYRIPGTSQFDPTPTLIDSRNLPILAPGAVQLANLSNDNGKTPPYLIVADQLGNDILVYPGLADGTFGSPASYPVGFAPVAVTVNDFNGDGVPDLAVVNEASNDVSILNGSIDSTTGLWTASPGPRLNSGGVGPIAVAAGSFTNNGIPDLRVTNSNGQIATLPGIGSADKGTGFFLDANPQLSSLGNTITQAVFDPATGAELVVGANGAIFAFDGNKFTLVDPGGPAVTTIALDGDTLAAAFENGGIGLFSRLPNGDFGLTSEDSAFEDQVSALELLQTANSGMELYLTAGGSDVPLILPGTDFIAIATQLPQGPVVAQPSSLATTDLVLIPVLVPGPTTDNLAPEPVGTLADGVGVAFTPFGSENSYSGPAAQSKEVAPVQGGSRTDDNMDDNLAVPFSPAGDRVSGQAPWEVFGAGVEEAFQQLRSPGQMEGQPPKALESLRRLFEQFRDWWYKGSGERGSMVPPTCSGRMEGSFFFMQSNRSDSVHLARLSAECDNLFQHQFFRENSHTLQGLDTMSAPDILPAEENGDQGFEILANPARICSTAKDTLGAGVVTALFAFAACRGADKPQRRQECSRRFVLTPGSGPFRERFQAPRLGLEPRT